MDKNRKIVLMFDENEEIYDPEDLGFDENDFEFFETEIFNEFTVNSGGTRYTLSVYGSGSEGPIPHFHVKKNGKGKEACLCIFEPKYFSHDSHQGELSKEDLKKIDKILAEQNKRNLDKTNWKEIADEWIELNGNSFANYKGIKTDKAPTYAGIKFSDQHPDAKPNEQYRELL